MCNHDVDVTKLTSYIHSLVWIYVLLKKTKVKCFNNHKQSDYGTV